jgi:hypothetical protein
MLTSLQLAKIYSQIELCRLNKATQLSCMTLHSPDTTVIELLAIDGKKERHTDGRTTKTTEKQYQLDK